MAFVLDKIGAGRQLLEGGTISIAQKNAARIMPKDDTATVRATKRFKLRGRALAAVDIDDEFHTKYHQPFRVAGRGQSIP